MNRAIVADRAGELDNFKVSRGSITQKDRTDFVEQVKKTLGREHGIDVARDGRFDFEEIVIRLRLGELEFDGGGGSAGIVGNSGVIHRVNFNPAAFTGKIGESRKTTPRNAGAPSGMAHLIF